MALLLANLLIALGLKIEAGYEQRNAECNKERMNSLIEEGTEKYIYFVNTTKRGEELEGYTTAVYEKPSEE